MAVPSIVGRRTPSCPLMKHSRNMHTHAQNDGEREREEENGSSTPGLQVNIINGLCMGSAHALPFARQSMKGLFMHSTIVKIHVCVGVCAFIRVVVLLSVCTCAYTLCTQTANLFNRHSLFFSGWDIRTCALFRTKALENASKRGAPQNLVSYC